MRRPRLLVIVGTRPEVVKMAPVIAALRAQTAVSTRVLSTGQHRTLLDQALAAFGIVPDVDLGLMRDGQPLDAALAALLVGIGAVLEQERPDRVVVHGDTLTMLAGTLAAHLRGVPVAHVEAGLRSGDLSAPWPEEASRRVGGVIADLHFAPTEAAAAALRGENVPGSTIHLTGNTVADALQAMRARLAADPMLGATIAPVLAHCAGRRVVTVTVHRRENHGAPLRHIATALAQLAARPDVIVVLPLHPNPVVAGVLRDALAAHPAVTLLPPLDYPAFVRLMAASTLILTDSGGVQEEAPALGVPVLVLRDATERPEGVAAGGVRIVGTDPVRIVAAATELLDDPDAYAAMAVTRDCYGDGRAATRIADILVRTMTGEAG
ncbi:UDP-N-acetylglucosamine 2-epimerase (non-hydrolyzing) [Sphingomonas sp. BE138]|uniref:non-hydrolyzing UDP-N-acetylglucosamine 2-epimerase n=1 Tax=Sphingomonas sp. BE138 TaxID=2817845 RepID=UPI00285DF4A5|nr:UDP-N-acetylglucosamine 2-epimerase (non-hydrolyzing) [Sphingomonas sp. BE138]MDR6788260.1 UDP-N-acetylglucosamine 2-epimerase (non-hydrolyzing) [Sphingomonas sp. BE138]